MNLKQLSTATWRLKLTLQLWAACNWINRKGLGHTAPSLAQESGMRLGLPVEGHQRLLCLHI